MENYQSLIHFENVGLRYNSKEKEILKDINLLINKGDFLFLIGESGSGKSSLLNLMNASLKPSRGYLNILNHDVNLLNETYLSYIRRKIGIIFQDFRLINHLSIYENIALPLKIEGLHFDEIDDKVNDMLKWIDLTNYKHAMPPTLSGGQQQRVAIARSVINNPEIILADEPTGSVDTKMAEKILNMLEYMNNQGVAVVFATHNLDLISKKQYPVLLLQNAKLQVIKND